MLLIYLSNEHPDSQRTTSTFTFATIYKTNAKATRLATPSTDDMTILEAPDGTAGAGVGLFVGKFGAPEAVGDEGEDIDGAAEGSRVTGVTGGSVEEES